MDGQASRDDPWILIVDRSAGIANVSVSIVTIWDSVTNGCTTLTAEFHIAQYKR